MCLVADSCRKHGISYYNPQLVDWNTWYIPLEAAAKDSCKLLLYVVAADTRGVTSMLEVSLQSLLGLYTYSGTFLGKLRLATCKWSPMPTRNARQIPGKIPDFPAKLCNPLQVSGVGCIKFLVSEKIVCNPPLSVKGVAWFEMNKSLLQKCAS